MKKLMLKCVSIEHNNQCFLPEDFRRDLSDSGTDQEHKEETCRDTTVSKSSSSKYTAPVDQSLSPAAPSTSGEKHAAQDEAVDEPMMIPMTTCHYVSILSAGILWREHVAIN